MSLDKHFLDEAKQQYAQSQNALFDTYLSSLRNLYSKLSFDQKTALLNALDSIIVNDFDVTLPSTKTYFSDGKFVGSVAKQVRIDANLTQKQLSVKVLNFPEDYYVRVSMFETGRKTPSRTSKKGFTFDYLNWLKSRGYNPYD